MSVQESPDEDFKQFLRTTPLSQMTSELEEKLRIFSCECTKQSCLLLLQDLAHEGQCKVAIRSMLIYKIKGVCFRHFMSAMPLSRIPSNLADMLLEDKSMSLFDAVEMAFDETRLVSFVSAQKEYMCANIIKYNVSLNSLHMDMLTRERQMVLDLNKAKCDLEEQQLCTMKFSQMALNLQETLNENYSDTSAKVTQPRETERRAVTTQTARGGEEEERQSAPEDNGDERGQPQESGDGVSGVPLLTQQTMQQQIDEYEAKAEAKAEARAAELRDGLERQREESIKCVRTEMQHMRQKMASEKVEALACLRADMEQMRQKMARETVEALACVHRELADEKATNVLKTQVQHEKNANLEKDLNRLRAVKNGKDRAEEKGRKELQRMRVKLVEAEESVLLSEGRVCAAQEEIVVSTDMWKARLAESEERAQAAVAMFVIMQADYKVVREEGEAKEKLLTIDLRKMEIYDAIQKKLKLELKRAPCSGLVGTKILAKVQGDAAERVARCWKAYAVRKGERELRARVLREAQERLDDRREAEAQEARDRAQLFAELAAEAVAVRRIVDLDGGDSLSTVIFDTLMRLRDPKRMLFATIAWTVRQDLVIHDLPESVMVDFLELTKVMEMLPGDEAEAMWNRMIDEYGPGEEESIVAHSPPLRANWPAKRGDFRLLFNALEEPQTQLACAEALLPWFEDGMYLPNAVCARLKCGKGLEDKAVRCAQCRHARYCSPECGLADIVHHDAECHVHTLRALFRLYRTRGMASRSIVRMFFAGPPAVQPCVVFRAGCYASCCVGQRVQEIRSASGV